MKRKTSTSDYKYRALIGEAKPMLQLASRFSETTQLVDLANNLYMIPLTEIAFKLLNKVYEDDDAYVVMEGTDDLTVNLFSTLSRFSEIGIIIYLEDTLTDQIRSESVFVWNHSTLNPDKYMDANAINEVLRLIGVKATEGKTEYQTLEIPAYINKTRHLNYGYNPFLDQNS